MVTSINLASLKSGDGKSSIAINLGVFTALFGLSGGFCGPGLFFP